MRYFPILAFFDESNVVSAAKADDLKKKYPALADEIGALAEADPSPTKKYLEWAVGQLREGVHTEELVAAIQAYDKVLNRLTAEDKNFTRFKTVAEMQEATERASAVETRGDVKKRSRKGGVVLYGDKKGDRWLLVRPTTMDGAIYWGSNTSWCVARRDKSANLFYNYVAGNNVQFYFLIDKDHEVYTEEAAGKSSDPHFSKLAMLFADGKPYATEPFQDAANRAPSKAKVEKAIGPEFEALYELALKDAKKHPTTWAYELMSALGSGSFDVKQFLSLYDEHREEIRYFRGPELSKLGGAALDMLPASEGSDRERLEDVIEDMAGYADGGSRFMSKLVYMAGRAGEPGGMTAEFADRIFERASKSKDGEVLGSLARQPRLTKDMVQRLLESNNHHVVWGLSTNPALFKNKELLDLFLESRKNIFNGSDWNDDAIWGNLLANPGCSLEQFKELFNKSTTTTVRVEALADSLLQYASVMYPEAMKVSEEKLLFLLEHAAQDPDGGPHFLSLNLLLVKAAKAARRGTILQVALDMALKLPSRIGKFIVAAMAENGNNTSYIFERMLKLDDSYLSYEARQGKPTLAAIAANPSLPAALVNKVLDRAVAMYKAGTLVAQDSTLNNRNRYYGLLEVLRGLAANHLTGEIYPHLASLLSDMVSDHQKPEGFTLSDLGISDDLLTAQYDGKPYMLVPLALGGAGDRRLYVVQV